VLATTGIRVDSERARNILSKAIGCSSDDDRIRIPAELVEQSIGSAPSSIEVYTRAGDVAFCLDAAQNSQTYFGIGVTNLWYQDFETDAVLPFTRKHVEISTRLGGTLTSFDVVSTPGIIQKPSAEHAELYAALEMIANTTKPLVILASNAQQFRNALQALQHLHGDLSEGPFVIPYFNPVTPLALNEDTADKMFLTIEHGVPFVYSNYGMSGATTPITAGGTLVMLNAELLAGLVLTQLFIQDIRLARRHRHRRAGDTVAPTLLAVGAGRQARAADVWEGGFANLQRAAIVVQGGVVVPHERRWVLNDVRGRAGTCLRGASPQKHRRHQ
jgi:trimethylamine--corrinoid protein Co-methyltransferase